MRNALGALAAIAALAAGAGPARGDAVRRTIAPMTRADGEVCDLLRAQVQDRCKRVARDGTAAVYQSGSTAAGVRRLVLAIDTGRDVLIGPAVDVLSDQLQSTRSTLRSIAIDGHPGIALHVVATWKRGASAESTQSLVGCAAIGQVWKCSLVDVGRCDASLADDGSVTTSCGATATLSLER
ncbi:MAG TPA: hypothetical protein VGD80_33245 [Kofleriaceae bacterium]